MKAVVGLGKSGVACLQHLVAQGEEVVGVDNRNHPPGLAALPHQLANVPLYLGSFDIKILAAAEELVVSPGISLDEPVIQLCRQKGVRVIRDLELFARTVKQPVVAITGSNGKSTVTQLVGQMVAAAGIPVGVGGNLGTPALDLLRQEAACYVLELSSFQLESAVSFHAQVATVLNVSEDHLDRYASYTDYLQAKQQIYRGCQIAVINLDDPASYAGVELPTQVISFSARHPAGEMRVQGDYLTQNGQPVFALSELKIFGEHNALNVAAAWAIGRAMKLPTAAMVAALREFPGLPHRCQWVANLAGVDWYNDSKGTNVGATCAALAGLGARAAGKVILIAGGVGKGADFTPLAAVVAKYARVVIVLGRDAPLIEHDLAGATKLQHASSLAAAVSLAESEALPGDVVLLSPACASFDMFDNFEQRGEIFTMLVNQLSTK